MGDKAGKLVRGSMLRMADFVMSAVTGLVLMPFIVHSLGDRMYGLWVFAGSFLGYYGLMDFGLSSAVQRYVSRALSLKDYDETNKIVSTAFFIFTCIGTLALLVAAGTAWLVPLLVSNVTEAAVFRQVIIILGVSFAVGFPLRVFSGILSATLRYDVSTGVDLARLVLRTVCIAVFLMRGYGIFALTLITFFADVSGYLARYFIVRRLYPFIIVSRKNVDLSRIRSLFSYSVYTFISQVADQLRFNVNNLVITMFLGLGMVTTYSIGSRLTTYFIVFMVAAVGMLAPVFSEYEAGKRYAEMTEKFLFTTKISGYLSFFIGGMLIIFGKAFIGRWMGQEYLSSYTILVLLTVPLMIALVQSPSLQLLFGISKHRFFAVANIAEGLANLLLSIILVSRYGLVGVALGAAVPMLVIKLLVQPVYTCRAIQLDLRTYYLGTLMPVMLKAAGILVCIRFAVQPFLGPDYITILALAGASSVFFFGAAFTVGFTGEERNSFIKAVSRKVPVPRPAKTV